MIVKVKVRMRNESYEGGKMWIEGAGFSTKSEEPEVVWACGEERLFLGY